jgi:hypothetical protein
MSAPPTIAAIETVYKGYRFRSRLEARWAVFFDAMQIAFQYEPEGYKLPDGQLYLPDFWLPQVMLFAEVKPAVFTEAEEWRCRNLPYDCLMLDGPPEPRAYFLAGSREDVHMNLGGYHLTEGRFFMNGDAYFDSPDTWYSEWDASDLAAIFAARSARFEHGEHP